MSSLTTLARPYAKAAFELAQGDQALARWDDMLGLGCALVSEESLADLLTNPEVERGTIISLVADVAGDAFDDPFKRFLGVLAENDRLPLLPQVWELFREFREEAENRLFVRVVSAVALDEDQSARLKEALARRFEREIELKNEVDGEVIGGAIVYAGDQVIDGSLRGRLNKLSNSLAP
ncbi:MAG: F0F1 ATP synthase subunit delta [Xanthomonadales bacterium]|nr:F0F1 ATP synthase subunit delta [Gammaproteobacteria bacterium]MBT8051155.1 F0F1 ATP synthase subunit delta [Gammaproteobacteria bacterium]MBT8056979.1 F0F1 ATP synthase subunit delta [Gammaproteobacteria bacterium]NNJ77666.1 F0F1 ATP synthase subunit delta [Xanthomonadales bacterium]NNL04869.1 F0F1 ATP synthase subunit delta [Xanthomonadales bacterium]